MDRKLCSLQEKLGYNFPEWKQGKQKRWIQQVMCIHLLHWNLCVQTGEQAAGFVEKINQEGAGMWIKSLQLEKDETAMKGTMEVVYCHDQ